MVKAERFALYQVKALEDKQRLAVVVSPNELNDTLNTVIVVPLLGSQTKMPFRVPIIFKGKNGEIALDKITTIPKVDLVQKVGLLPELLVEQVIPLLAEMFS